ncbi:glutamate formimidoyltransferase [Mucilaginibacter glaciei]|uniref:glutamate formimidoyltransferase n=1 Tax=Mucilaginibacter glaciei TaxID=2772109 RepID=A0A926P0K6_9SPHI|nr:glutamate formimidoyltransferase [Mucilaginibacter glaciei]MBD1395443.1 glutamate formimidoyltransferase [Mucilaginibacter glaciei]
MFNTDNRAKQLIECVPNFSEGVDAMVIKQIAGEIAGISGVKLLNVDPGKAANRTVITFAGEPGAVVEAAFLAIKKAGELIDMRVQKGEHPRMGATDVCPLIPIAHITMDETVVYAVQLARRVGEELQIPVYLYEHSQPDKRRSNLSIIRAGEYEGFFSKIKREGWAPDFGPAENDLKRGATVIGARDFLIAYNVNLNTDSVVLANEIAFDVRESGRKVGTDENGKSKYISGSLKSVKSIGWYIAEYGKAQVSMNLTNVKITPIHIAYDEVCDRANKHGVKVTGSELIGMIPLKAMLDAGSYFLQKRGRSAEVGDAALIDMAVTSMGLDELTPFNPQERIIEYVLAENKPAV